MNYDLIIKLAKLANNNPNDNEANAAARKVCRLLAEGNYQFNTPPKASKLKEPTYNATYYDQPRSGDPIWDYVYNDINKERQWNSPFDRDASWNIPYNKEKKESPYIHRCQCGSQEWYFYPQKNSWICSRCAFHVTKIQVAHEKWRMK